MEHIRSTKSLFQHTKCSLLSICASSYFLPLPYLTLQKKCHNQCGVSQVKSNCFPGNLHHCPPPSLSPSITVHPHHCPPPSPSTSSPCLPPSLITTLRRFSFLTAIWITQLATSHARIPAMSCLDHLSSCFQF